MSDPSLTTGWLPPTVSVVTAVALGYAAGWRPPRWRRAALPAAVGLGAACALAAHWWIADSGVTGEPVPWSVWMWTAFSGTAVGVAAVGWRDAGWFLRNATVFAASFALLSTGLTINGWIGYLPTVSAAWGALTGAPPSGRITLATATAMRAAGTVPPAGRVVGIDTGSAASDFGHRDEWAYLPPAWFRGDTPPAVLMIGGEFTTPADWIRSGDAVATADAYARAHNGRAPVLVFADPSGSFAVDTECVNGIRGRAADHLTGDVLPYVRTTLEVQGRWGVVGFSAGGTCAFGLAVRHPELFSAFVAVGADERPTAGTEAQTVDRLFGGDRAARDAFDPAAVLRAHGPYTDLAATFVVAEASATDDVAAARSCARAAAQNISCRVLTRPGRHVWPFAATAFAETLPWLAGAAA